ncbi:MAG: hypothetical protein GY769_16535 [bacterium]|nr:hypothetical protein [bacterium]
MKRYAVLFALIVLATGCGAGEDVAQAPAGAEAGPAIELQVEAPEPLAEPEYKSPASDTDWEAKVNNKNIEIVQVLNIINPVAAYIGTGFEQYGDRFDATLHEEWTDTQVQLGSATTLYDDCKTRMEAGNFDKQLFLDMEEVWQLLVKTGVAGVRTKSMIDEALEDIAG